MKKINTTVSTGTKLIYKGREVTIGMVKHKLIQFKTRINETSGFTEMITTKELNKRLKESTIL